MIEYPNSIPDVGELVSSVHVQIKAENRIVFLKILQNVKFLGRQGIAFRGHEDVESNFIQLFKLRDIDYPGLSDWIKKRTDKYLSPEIENEILQLMSLTILRNIATQRICFQSWQMSAQICQIVNN